MNSPTGILSFSQVTVGAGTPITSQVRTRGLPATWLTASALGSSNVGGTAGEKPDSPNPKTLLPPPSSLAAQGCLGRPFSVAGVGILCFAVDGDRWCFIHQQSQQLAVSNHPQGRGQKWSP